MARDYSDFFELPTPSHNTFQECSHFDKSSTGLEFCNKLPPFTQYHVPQMHR